MDETLSPEDTEAIMAADFRIHMLRFRQLSGRPLTAKEHAMVKLFHAGGFMEGFKTGFRAIFEAPPPAPPAPGQES